MNNKTGLVALVVLAAATLLMVFFVLPNMNRQKPAETVTEAAADAPAGETKTADGKQARGTPAEDTAATQPAAGEEAAGTAEPAAAETADAQQDATPAQADADTAQATGEPAAQEQATQEAASQETAGQDASGQETTAEGAAGQETAGAADADAAAEWVVPAFDLLRVEPDGSTVIAGRAEPNTKVEIRDGETVVATADVGPSGDFAAVFDEPLKAGDYQLTLNASDGKGVSRTSEEVATVSVPSDAGGEVLAMVSEPGTASRLITVPDDADASAAAAEEQPAGEPVAEPAEASPEADASSAQAGETAAATTADDTGTAAGGEDAATTTADDAATAGAASADAARAQVRVAAVELEGERMFVAGNARPGALVRIYAGDRLVGEAKADEEGRFVVDGRIALAVGRHTIRADVMAADGSRVELRAAVPFDRPEGEQVAVVAQDDTASAQATPALGLVGGGTFDRLRGDAAKALALLKGLFADGRVPTAEELAAARSATEIALKSLAEFKPGAEEGEVARDMAARASAAAADALARLRALPDDAANVGAALGAVETAVAAALAPAIETAEDAGTQAAAAEAAATETQATPDEAAPATDGDVAAAPSQTAEDAGAADAGAQTEASQDVAGAAGSDAETAGTEDAAAADAGAQAEASQDVAGTAGSDAAAAAESQQAAAGEPETVEQAPLQASKTSVIIRRGDTLWQISRRIYGKGVRYTTIYLANQDQIVDPDRIVPGQVFGVPDEATETDADAEALHRRHLRGE